KRLSRIRLQDRAEELIGVTEASQRVDELQLRLVHASTIKMNTLNERLKRFDHVLSALNPKLVLKRGYSFVEAKGKVLPSLSQFNNLPSGTKLTLQFHDGKGEVTKD